MCSSGARIILAAKKFFRLKATLVKRLLRTLIFSIKDLLTTAYCPATRIGAPSPHLPGAPLPTPCGFSLNDMPNVSWNKMSFYSRHMYKRKTVFLPSKNSM
jgi:hypothetical protein